MIMLHEAVNKGDYSEVKELLELNKNRTGLYWNLMNRLIGDSRTKKVKSYFFKKYINKKDEGNIPLNISLNANTLEISELLIEYGADVYKKDSFGKTPLYIILQKGNLKLAKLVFEQDIDVNKLESGVPLLHTAASSGNVKLVKFLIGKGADINKTDMSFKESPLHIATTYGDVEMTITLIENGADINCVDILGESPLVGVLKYDDSEMARVLIEYGANVDGETKETSPLYIASKQENKEMIELILSKNPNVKTF